ncbi:MAG: hypothetical protein AB7V50_11150 [Vampirovibrionia bacterium]
MSLKMIETIMKPINRMVAPVVRPIENVSAIAITDIANTGALKKFADWSARESGKVDRFNREMTNFEAKLIPTMSAVLPIWISSFYVFSNLKSKEIPKERKIPLLINDIIICAFSTLAGFTVVKLFNTMELGMKERVKELLMKTCKDQETYNKQKSMYQKGIKQMMFIAAFTFVFRFLGPVIATPLADKVNKFLIKKGLIEDPSVKKPNDNKEQVGSKLDISTAITNTQSEAFKNMLMMHSK